MTLATVVIGAGFGDEGKGLITDFETRKQQVKTVCRFNGGSQAGHTVVSGSKSFVFGSISAGSFAGADTYLSSDFILNPLVMEGDNRAFRKINGAIPRITVHPNARVSTVYDMSINSIVETFRSNGRHGSCGLGINETVTRHSHGGFGITARDVQYKSTEWLAAKLTEINKEWVPNRLKMLMQDADLSGPEYRLFLDVFNMPELYHANALKDASLNFDISTFYAKHNVVLEGAQGLMLDEFIGEFPHVTRSITGLPGAVSASIEMGISEIKPIYVTRTYCTRHGAGPLKYENVPFGHEVNDTTNIEGPWQGKLRYAPLNLQELNRFIQTDLARSASLILNRGIKLQPPTLAITCADQMGPHITYADIQGVLQTCRSTDFVNIISEQLRLPISHVSYGPQAINVVAY